MLMASTVLILITRIIMIMIMIMIMASTVRLHISIIRWHLAVQAVSHTC